VCTSKPTVKINKDSPLFEKLVYGILSTRRLSLEVLILIIPNT
jgi:hypothetical protein